MELTLLAVGVCDAEWNSADLAAGHQQIGNLRYFHGDTIASKFGGYDPFGL
jgi:hypothetical protein